MADGTTGTDRLPVVVILLTIITLGIYGLYCSTPCSSFLDGYDRCFIHFPNSFRLRSNARFSLR